MEENIGEPIAPKEPAQPQVPQPLPAQPQPAQQPAPAQVSKQGMWVGLVLFLVVAMIIAYVLMTVAKKKKERESLLRKDLADNTGGLVNGSVDNVIKDVEKPDVYTGVQEDAKAIKASGCYADPFFGYCMGSTRSSTLLTILAGKTKKHIAALNDAFKQLFSRSLDNWMQSNLSSADLQKAYQLMLNAK